MIKNLNFQCTNQLVASCIQVEIYYCPQFSEKLKRIVKILKRMKLNALMQFILS